MGVAPSSAPESSPVQQTTIIGIVIAGIASAILLAVVIVAVAVYHFHKRKQDKAESTSAECVEVSAEDGNSFNSKLQPMKTNTQGDYEAMPTSFNKENLYANTHTAL